MRRRPWFKAVSPPRAEDRINLPANVRADTEARSVWVALHLDFSAIVIFDDELQARRYANRNYMDVHNVPLGEDIRRFILRN